MKYEVILYYHSYVSVVVEAEDKRAARTLAEQKVEDAMYNEQLFNNLVEYSVPDVEEI